MKEEDYKMLPSWTKTDINKCDCGGNIALFYDENEMYYTRCTGCKCTIGFSANGMIEAKEVLNVGRKIEKPELIDLMKHAVGLDYKNPYKRNGRLFYKPYRNYFNTTPTDKAWNEIMNAGCACMGSPRHFIEKDYEYDSVNFYLTRVGLDRLGEYLKVNIHDVSN